MPEGGAGIVAGIAAWWKGLSVASQAVIKLAAYAAASAAVSLASSAVAKSSLKDSETDSGAHLQNTMTSERLLPLIYGNSRVGINLVYVGTTGGENNYLHLVGAIGEGPLSAVNQVFLNDKPITRYNSLWWHYEFFNGAADQAVCATLHAAIPAWNDPLRHTAYIYLRLLWSDEIWQGIPTVTLDVDGLEVWDPTANVVAYSNNPALCAYDMITRPSTRGGMGLDVWHGPAPVAPRLSLASVEDARAYCAAKGWTCNMPVGDDAFFADNLALVLALFRGDLVYSENAFALRYRDLNYESVVMSLTTDDVVRAGDRSSLRIVQPAMTDRPNALRIKYLSANTSSTGMGRSQTADLVITDSAAIAADGDYREKEIKLYGMSGKSKLKAMGYYYLERLRWNKQVSMVLGSRAMVLEPLDLVQLTHPFPGWENKKLRVLSLSISGADQTVSVTAVEEDAELYNAAYDLTEEDWHDTSLPDPTADVPSVEAAALSEEVYYYRGRSFTRLKVNFSPPSDYPWWDYAEIYVSVGDEADYRYQTRSGGDYLIDPVEEGKTYFIKIRGVSIHGKKESMAAAPVHSRTIQGKTTTPGDVTGLSATVVNDAVYVAGTEVADPDIEGYEFRISGADNTAWAAAVYLASNIKPVWQAAGMRAGTFRVFCAAKGNNGLYSDTPASTTFTVGVPHGYALLATESIDHDDAGDTHDNTEAFDEGGGQWALRVDHTGGLTGTYTSREMDLGSSQTVRVQGDFITKIVDSAATWEALWPAPAAWNTKDMSLSWAELFGISAASKISAKLKWGTVSGALTNEAALFERLAVTAVGRYFQVEITITDPHDAQYLLLTGPSGDPVLTVTFYS
jgi:hypothetical protein